MATSTPVAIDEYLRVEYDPDVEYVDGELKERPMVMIEHGALQSQLSFWFISHKKEWKIRVAVEGRVRVSPTRIRLPDVIVGTRGDWPQVLVDPPMIVIEILSPSDSFTETLKQINDYLGMGIPNVWIIDPAKRTAFVCRNDAPPDAVTRLTVEDSPIYVDITELFAALDEDVREV
jgi:Uma2 family endonuclease